jgi:DUF4097 and DUF4098 domain-containing protein YvlB
VKQIEVNIGLGDISARANGNGKILVHARIRSNNEAELETTIADGVLKVSQRQNGGNGQFGDWFQPSSSLDVILIVPAGWDLPVTARTGKGDVSSDGVQGLREVHTGKGDVSTSTSARDLAIHTGMGDVSVRNGRGAVAVETGKGDVSISEVRGGLQVRTGFGDVSVHDWQAPAATNGGRHAIRTGSGDVSVSRAQAPSLEVHTGRGDCAFDKITVADLRVHSGSGDVALDGDPATGKWDVRTGKGDLNVRIPARAARIEAATRHGDISSDLPQVKAARPGPASQRGGRFISVMGDEPRAEILLDTGHGDISVRLAVAPLQAPATTEWAIAEPVSVPVVPVAQKTSIATPQADTKATALAILESLSRGELAVDEAEALLRSLEPA